MHDVQGYYTLMAWLPSYFELALGLDVQNSSLLTLIPYLAMTAMTPFVSLSSALRSLMSVIIPLCRCCCAQAQQQVA